MYRRQLKSVGEHQPKDTGLPMAGVTGKREAARVEAICQVRYQRQITCAARKLSDDEALN